MTGTWDENGACPGIAPRERRQSVRISGHELYLSHMAEVRALNREIAVKDEEAAGLRAEIVRLSMALAACEETRGGEAGADLPLSDRHSGGSGR